jgi:hypothetical protein
VNIQQFKHVMLLSIFSLCLTATLVGCQNEYGSFQYATDLPNGRGEHKAFLLKDGRVLLIGGTTNTLNNPNKICCDSTTKIELYDPVKNAWNTVETFDRNIGLSSIVLGQNGQIFISGGYDDPDKHILSRKINILNPDSGHLTFLANMQEPRMQHQVTLLKDGRLLISGGIKSIIIGKGVTRTNTAEIFDPNTNATRYVKGMGYPREGHKAVLTADGKVFIIGGGMELGKGAIPLPIEIYDLKTNSYLEIQNKYNITHILDVIRLNNGNLFIAGGSDPQNVEHSITENSFIFNTKNSTFQDIGKARLVGDGAATTLLANGNILLSGGLQGDSSYVIRLKVTEIYDFSKKTYTSGPQMQEPRSFHQTTLLKNGQMMITGGSYTSGRGHSNKTEVFIDKGE